MEVSTEPARIFATFSRPSFCCTRRTHDKIFNATMVADSEEAAPGFGLTAGAAAGDSTPAPLRNFWGSQPLELPQARLRFPSPQQPGTQHRAQCFLQRLA